MKDLEDPKVFSEIEQKCIDGHIISLEELSNYLKEKFISISTGKLNSNLKKLLTKRYDFLNKTINYYFRNFPDEAQFGTKIWALISKDLEYFKCCDCGKLLIWGKIKLGRCQKCGAILREKSYTKEERQIRSQNISLAQIGKKQSSDTVEKRALKNRGKKRTEEQIKNMKVPHRGGWNHTEETKKIISDSSKKHWENEEYANKVITNERKAVLKRIEDNYGICLPNYNKRACEFFKKFESVSSITGGRYAMYGNGEFYIKKLGFWLDYFNEEFKLIIEWDEEGHFDPETGFLTKKDIRRQKEIQNLYPDFTFLRIREKALNRGQFKIEALPLES